MFGAAKLLLDTITVGAPLWLTPMRLDEAAAAGSSHPVRRPHAYCGVGVGQAAMQLLVVCMHCAIF